MTITLTNAIIITMHTGRAGDTMSALMIGKSAQRRNEVKTFPLFFIIFKNKIHLE